MRAGLLRERVTIQRQTTTTDPQWGPTPTWNDIATVWASVSPTDAGESFGQQGVSSSIGYAVKLRYRSDLSSADRLKWNGLVLDIVGVINVGGRNRELEVKAVQHGQQ